MKQSYLEFNRRRPRRPLAVALLLVVLLHWQWSLYHRKPSLQASVRGGFKIAVFSDLHYGEDEHSFGIEQDRKSKVLMRRVLAAEKPDLVVLNGDLITGENTFAFNSTAYVGQIVQPLIERGYPWASTYGNHDSKYNLGRDRLFEAESQFKNSMTQRSGPDTDGITNYYIPIYPHRTLRSIISSASGLRSLLRPPKPVALLWFLDSRGGAGFQHDPPNQDDIPNHVSARTAAWLATESAKLKAKYGVLPSLAFVHIPVRAFSDLQSSETPPLVHSDQYPGMNDDKPLARQGYSEAGKESVPLMQVLQGMEGLHSVYSGHDHGDSWCGRWPGNEGDPQRKPFLCFCKHSGYGGYGTWNRGVRQLALEFDDDEMVTHTWVRMEGGEVITAVTLNETYGTDVYSSYDGGYHDY